MMMSIMKDHGGFQTLSRPLYDNRAVYSPTGQLMFMCGRKRIGFYMNRSLAIPLAMDDSTLILDVEHGRYGFPDSIMDSLDIMTDVASPKLNICSSEAAELFSDVLAIRLNFQPAGVGNRDDVYSLSLKHNVCVVCQTELHLTRHSIVPATYRRHFPASAKNRLSHDHILVCRWCCERYSRPMGKYVATLAIKYDAPVCGIGGRPAVSPELRRAASAAKALLDKTATLPDERRRTLLSTVSAYRKSIGRIGIDDEIAISADCREDCSESDLMISEDELRDILHYKAAALGPRSDGEDFISHGELVVHALLRANNSEVQKRIQEFVECWRSHFIETLRPVALPAGWSITRSAFQI